MADSPGRREVLQDLLRGAAIPFDVVSGWSAFLASGQPVCTGHRARRRAGLPAADPALLLLADGDLFGQRAQQERRRRRSQLDPAGDPA